MRAGEQPFGQRGVDELSDPVVRDVDEAADVAPEFADEVAEPGRARANARRVR